MTYSEKKGMGRSSLAPDHVYGLTQAVGPSDASTAYTPGIYIDSHRAVDRYQISLPSSLEGPPSLFQPARSAPVLLGRDCTLCKWNTRTSNVISATPLSLATLTEELSNRRCVSCYEGANLKEDAGAGRNGEEQTAKKTRRE